MQRRTALKVVNESLHYEQRQLFKPLTDNSLRRVHQTALHVLEKIGMAEPLPEVRDAAIAAGCRLTDTGRLCFPASLVEDLIANADRDQVRYGRDPVHDFDTSSGRVYNGPAGTGSEVLDVNTGKCRPSTLVDFYDFVRLADALENIHMVSDWIGATDISDSFEHDVSKAYVLAAGSNKPVLTGIVDGASAEAMVSIFEAVLQGKTLRERPYVVFAGCCTRPPLTFGDVQSEALIFAARCGARVCVEVAPQFGATAPTAFAGGLVQMLAEMLAAFVQIQLLVPGHWVEFGFYPFLTDLRNASFTSGAGEQALISAATAQLGNYYGIPYTVGAAMTDAKVCDFQGGYEKGIGASLTGVAGGNLIGMSSGMLANAALGSLEALVVDDDLYGSLNSALQPIEVNDETLSFDLIRQTVEEGVGHFLGNEQTQRLMRSQYYYPKLADRSPSDVWMSEGCMDLSQRARQKVQEILSSHYPQYIDAVTDKKLRQQFPIQLSYDAMQLGSNRWQSKST